MELTMTTYKNVWDSMNDLEMMTPKLGYLKEMIDTALEYMDSRDNKRAEAILTVCSDFVKYYLEDYDTQFTRAWGITIEAGREVDSLKAEISRIKNPENPQYTDEEMEAMTNQNEIKELLS